MKKRKLLAAVCIPLMLLVSCDKIWDMAHGGSGNDSDIKKLLRLKAFSRTGRTYNMHYDVFGNVDSVVARNDNGASGYTYVVTHHGKYIDSTALWSDGKLVSSRKDIRYNQKGQIVQFTHQLYAVPGYPPTIINIGYNQAGDAYTWGDDQGYQRDTFWYNTDRGLKEITNGKGAPYKARYTNDNNLNPLSLIHGMDVIFNQETWPDFWYNRRNVTEKLQQSYPTQTTWLNEYDQYNRIIRKTDQTGTYPDNWTFTYF